MPKKYLIDTSIIASSLKNFKNKFISDDVTLILSNLTFQELEERKIDPTCSVTAKKFVCFLIDLFVTNTKNTEVFILEHDNSSNHIDQDLVMYAKEHNLCILTCDKGLALRCRFYGVECDLISVRYYDTSEL